MLYWFSNLPVLLLPQAHLSSSPDKEKGAQERLAEPLMSLVKSYEGGRESHARCIVQALFQEYLSVEELFNDNIQVSLLFNSLESPVLYFVYIIKGNQ